MPESAERDDRIFGLFPKFVPYLRRAPLEKAIGVLKAANREALLEILAEIPDEWEVDSTLRINTADFLVERAKFLEDTLIGRLEEEHPTPFGIVEREEEDEQNG